MKFESEFESIKAVSGLLSAKLHAIISDPIPTRTRGSKPQKAIHSDSDSDSEPTDLPEKIKNSILKNSLEYLEHIFYPRVTCEVEDEGWEVFEEIEKEVREADTF